MKTLELIKHDGYVSVKGCELQLNEIIERNNYADMNKVVRKLLKDNYDGSIKGYNLQPLSRLLINKCRNEEVVNYQKKDGYDYEISVGVVNITNKDLEFLGYSPAITLKADIPVSVWWARRLEENGKYEGYGYFTFDLMKVNIIDKTFKN